VTLFLTATLRMLQDVKVRCAVDRRYRVRNRLTAIFAMIALMAASAFAADEPKKAPEPLKIKVGDMAPDFTLLQYDGSKVTPVSLHDFRGKKQVALAFFVFAFTGG
jgi:cytochrome oxidase Cu insertion factor (SCO1/SenC/PrrC family)